MKKKLFLATAFSDKTNANGEVDPDFRKFVEKVLVDLKRIESVDVFCALEYEDWKISDKSPKVSVLKDLDELDASDVLILLLAPREQLSAGAHFELGYSIAKGIKVVLLAQSDDNLDFFIRGTYEAGLVTLVKYEGVDSIGSLLKYAVNTSGD
jgi:Nucleoside 2-deoxyribosyltransferase